MEDLSKLTVVKLKERLVARGLDTKGVKAILLKRLLEAMEADEKAREEVVATPEPEEYQEKMQHNQTIEEPSGTAEEAAERAFEEVARGESKSTEISPDDDAIVGERGVRRPSPELGDEQLRKRPRSDNESRPDDVVVNPSPGVNAGGALPSLLLRGDPTTEEAATGSPEGPQSVVVIERNASTLDLDVSPCEDEGVMSAPQGVVDKNEGHKTSSLKEDTDDRNSEHMGTLETVVSIESTVETAISDKPFPGLLSSSESNDVSEAEGGVRRGAVSVHHELLAAVNENSDSTSSKKRERPSRFSDRGTEFAVTNGPDVASEASQDSETDTFEDGTVTLDTYTSDMNCSIDHTCMIVTPFTETIFSMISAGVKCTHGFLRGKIRFDMRVLEILQRESSLSFVRIGVSELLEQQSAQIGDDIGSYALCSNGRKASSGKYEDFAHFESLKIDDSFTTLLNLDVEPAELIFAHNGKILGSAFKIDRGIEQSSVKEEDPCMPDQPATQRMDSRDPLAYSSGEPVSGDFPGETFSKRKAEPRALYPTVLTKNVKVQINLGQLESEVLEGFEEFIYPLRAPEHYRVRELDRPTNRKDSEVIMMVGLPSVGKSSWVQKYVKLNAKKHYNVLGTASVFARIANLAESSGKSDLDLQKATTCLTKLIEAARTRRRNFILDQTNVYSSAQRSKWKKFENFKKRVVVLVTDEKTLQRRHETRPREEQDLLPAKALLEMKASFELPSKSIFEDLEYVELSEGESRKIVDEMNKSASGKLGTGFSRLDRGTALLGSDRSHGTRGDRNNYERKLSRKSRSPPDFRTKGSRAGFRGENWGRAQGGSQQRWGNNGQGAYNNRAPMSRGGFPHNKGHNHREPFNKESDRRNSSYNSFYPNRNSENDRSRGYKERDHRDDRNNRRDQRGPYRDPRDRREDRGSSRDYTREEHRRNGEDSSGAVNSTTNQGSRWGSSKPQQPMGASTTSYDNGVRPSPPWHSVGTTTSQWSSSTISHQANQSFETGQPQHQWQPYQWQPASQPTASWEPQIGPETTSGSWRPGTQTPPRNNWSSSNAHTTTSGLLAGGAFPGQPVWTEQQRQWRQQDHWQKTLQLTSPQSSTPSSGPAYGERTAVRPVRAQHSYPPQQIPQWQQFSYSQNPQFKPQSSAPPQDK